MRPGFVLAFSVVASAAFAQYPGAETPPSRWAAGYRSIRAQDARSLIDTLAGPSFLGRSPDHWGHAAAAGYAMAWMQRWGVPPALKDGTYFQPVTVMEANLKAGATVSTANRRLNLVFGTDITFGAMADVDATFPVVFLRVAKDDPVPEATLRTLRDRIVVVHPDSRTADPEIVARLTAVGAMPVVPAKTKPTTAPVRFTQEAPPYNARPLMAVRMTEEAAARLAEALHASAYLRTTDKSTLVDGEGGLAVKAGVEATVRYRSMNLVTRIEGSDPRLARQAVVVGAHLDHLGPTERGIFWGADDNGSGSTALMLIARAFAQNPVRPKRTVILCLWTGEETGIYGSWVYANNPVVPLRDTVAYLNMDMVGRRADYKPWTDRPEDNVDSVYAGIAKLNSPDLYDLLHETNRYVNLNLRDDREDRTFRSDTGSFVRFGVPTLKAMTGEHPDYHKVTDTPDKIDPVKIANVAKWIYLSACELAERDGRPRFEAGAAYLRGRVAYLEKIALTPRAEIEVTLEDEAGRVLDRTTIRRPGQVPVAFALKYRPDAGPVERYRIRAVIREGARVIFLSPEAVPVKQGIEVVLRRR